MAGGHNEETTDPVLEVSFWRGKGEREVNAKKLSDHDPRNRTPIESL